VGDEEAHDRGAEISRSGTKTRSSRHWGDGVIAGIIVAFEYAIVASLLLVSAIVIVRTVVDFVDTLGGFPQSIIPAVDGILVVIILLDVVHTVFRHLRDAAFPVRPFLVIGILAGVRDILSASAHLTLSTNLSSHDFNQTLVALGVGVGLVLALLLGLLILSYADHGEDDQ
jgi:uncharacterized membrane protein (DUF373 family)